LKHIRLVPLFLLVLAFVVIIPQINQVHAPSSIVFKSFCDVGTVGASTINCTLSGVSTGDTIIVNIFGVGVFNGFTTTDGQSNTYSNKISSITGNGSGVSTYIFATLATASGGSLVVTVATGGGNRIYTFTASDYSGATGFGKTGTDQQDTAGNSGTSSISLTGTSSTSLMIDDFGIDGSTFSSVTPTSGQIVRDTPTNGGNTPCNGVCKATDGTSPILSWSWSGGSGCQTPPACFMSHSALELQGSQNTTPSTVQCYGNCGSPAITIVNTNSTHSINFNQSITLFYEFQSNLNGFVQNYTLNYAQVCGSGNKCTANTLFVALYTIPSCQTGQTPFSSQCPGSKISSSSQSPPTKARLSYVANNVQVFAGQWLGVSISASFNGIDINDTNTNVPLFQTNGVNPSIISSSSSASSLCAGCKMGLWVWISGNLAGSQPPPSVTGCINVDLSCFLFASACGLTPSNCFVGGAIIMMIYFTIFVVAIVLATSYINREYEMQIQFPPSLFFLFFLLTLFTFTAIGLVPQYVTIVIFILTALGVAGYFGSGFMGRSKSE
jgi:hypothetical protein